MPILVQRILEPAPRIRSRVAGRFLGQRDDRTRRLTEDTRGAAPEELARQPAPGIDTIGMPMAHGAVVEASRVHGALHGRLWDRSVDFPVACPEVGVPLAPDRTPPAGLDGKDLTRFDGLLARARERTRRSIADLTDAGRDRRFRVQTPWHAVGRFEGTPGGVLDHVPGHPAGHDDPINLPRHPYRATHGAPAGGASAGDPAHAAGNATLSGGAAG